MVINVLKRTRQEDNINQMRKVLNVPALLSLITFSLTAASTIDLTGIPGKNNGLGTAAFAGGNFIVQQISPQSTGTGVIDSFLRVQANGNNDSEQGYNTSNGTPYDDKGGNFTRALSLSEIPIVNLSCTAAGCTQVMSGGTAYRQFLLDINQTSANNLLDLNQIEIFQNNGDPACNNPKNTCGTSVTGTYPGLSGLPGNLIFQMSGADTSPQTTIHMDYSLNPGSGAGDMFLYVPDSDFASGITNVILYSQFGTPPGTAGTNDGFEEWAVLKPAGSPCIGCDAVPEPGSIYLLGSLVVGIGLIVRKRVSGRPSIATF
jgi:hypothetical protein